MVDCINVEQTSLRRRHPAEQAACSYVEVRQRHPRDRCRQSRCSGRRDDAQTVRLRRGTLHQSQTTRHQGYVTLASHSACSLHSAGAAVCRKRRGHKSSAGSGVCQHPYDPVGSSGDFVPRARALFCCTIFLFHN